MCACRGRGGLLSFRMEFFARCASTEIVARYRNASPRPRVFSIHAMHKKGSMVVFLVLRDNIFIAQCLVFPPIHTALSNPLPLAGRLFQPLSSISFLVVSVAFGLWLGHFGCVPGLDAGDGQRRESRGASGSPRG